MKKINMGWLDLSGIAKSNILKVTSYWLLLTPILSKFLNSINEIDLSYIGFDSPFSFNLPFSWQILFFSALMFAIGNVIYNIFCPKIISKYKNYQDYYNKSNSLNDMVELLADETVRTNSFKPNMLLIETVARNTPSSEIYNLMQFTNLDDAENAHWEKAINSLKESDKEKLPELFSGIIHYVTYEKKKQRAICSIFYVFGFILLFIVLLQNIKSVVESIL